jgi:hypothetical protein
MEPLLPGLGIPVEPRLAPDPPPWTRTTLPLLNDAATGEASKMPPPLPSSAAVFVAPGEYPPAALRWATLVAPTVMVPEALISNAPAPAPPALTALPPYRRRSRRAEASG